MVCCILSCCTTLLLINWVIGILLVEFALMKTKAVRKVNEERDSKYPAFRRYDVHLWKRSRFYIGIIELLTFNFFLAAFFLPIRSIITISSIILVGIFTK